MFNMPQTKELKEYMGDILLKFSNANAEFIALASFLSAIE
jgi:hypothetical protein